MDVVKRVQNCKSKCNRLSVTEQVKKKWGSHFKHVTFKIHRMKDVGKKKLDWVNKKKGWKQN